MASDEAPGHSHSSGPRQQRGGGPGEEEDASRGPARPERPDAGGDPVRVEPFGKAPQVKADVICASLYLTFKTVALTFPTSFRLFLFLFFILVTVFSLNCFKMSEWVPIFKDCRPLIFCLFKHFHFIYLMLFIDIGVDDTIEGETVP